MQRIPNIRDKTLADDIFLWMHPHALSSIIMRCSASMYKKAATLLDESTWWGVDYEPLADVIYC